MNVLKALRPETMPVGATIKHYVSLVLAAVCSQNLRGLIHSRRQEILNDLTIKNAASSVTLKLQKS